VIDLHTHSSFSDGSDTPTELAQNAHELGLSAIALTDHDTTASHDEMARACAEHGIELIAGVEVSLVDDEYPKQRNGQTVARNVHVLAYFLPLDPEHPLQQNLELLRQDRDERNRRLVALLQELGFGLVTLESIGRPHFARAMFELHPDIVGEESDESWRALFNDWLGSDGRAYIARRSMTISRFVDAAKGSGTVFSVAHPLMNYLEDSTSIESTMPRVLGSLRERGFRGVEAHYGGTSATVRALMAKLTRDAGMIPTGGSDYHGTYKDSVRLGFGSSGDLRVPDEVLDELKAARSANLS
jgi:predicted metal-dependent phosphoesterase TrpH